VAAVGESRITYDARGLVEIDGTPPGVAEIDGDKATFDARDLTTRKINAELRRLVYEEGVTDVTISNPGAKHSLGVGILTRCRITFDGSLGYFGCGLIDGPEIHVKGRVGWSACENMMSSAAASARAPASTRRAAR
jgi:methylamine---glutamate N-methyltransferase subunit B